MEVEDRPALLIVDDDLTFCAVLAKAMGKRGFNVTCAHTVEQATEYAEACMPEYAVVDLRLPGVSGLALVEKLKALDPGTRIVMLTGYASIATAVEAIKLGATHYLAKPVRTTISMAGSRSCRASTQARPDSPPSFRSTTA
jgi:two-component system response regulator RegA